jgi:hypothetical protein
MASTTGIAGVAIVLCLLPPFGRASATGKDGGVSIDNGILRLTVASDGALTVEKRLGHEFQPVLSGGRTFAQEFRGEGRPEVSVRPLTGVHVPGRAIEVLCRSKGAVLRVQYGLADNADGFTCTAWVQASDAPLRWDRIVVLEAQLDLGAGQVRSLTHDERWIAGVNVLGETRRTSQFFAAVFNRVQNRGAVMGALTAEAESCVDLRCKDGKVSLSLRTQYGGPGAGALTLAPGQTASSGAFAVFLPGDIFEGLEAYGRAVKRVSGIKLHEPIPCGWCSWDAFGWILHEKDLYATLDLIEQHRLVEYGFNTFQIDDGWQCGWRCSGDWRPNPNRFPGGIRPIADRAAKIGLTLGLWLGPFSDEDRKSSAGPGGQLNETAPAWMKAAQPVLDNHPEWMTTHDGRPTGNYDISHPDFLRHLTSLMDAFTNQWGVGYVKADFLAWGYGVQRDTSKPHHDIYRNAVQALRDGMKPGTYYLTCISHEWKSLGIADAQRIGNDVSGEWKGIEPTIRCAGPLYFTNGNFWWADPDQLHVGGQVDENGRQLGLTLDQARAWAALIALYGSVTLTGDRLDRLDPNRLRLLTQCLPSTGRTARPVDLFAVLSGKDPQRHSSIWHLPVVKPFGRWDVVGVFNWTGEPARRTVDLSRLGLDPNDRLLVWDYWAQEPVSHKPGDRTLDLDVAPTSCRLLVIHKDDGRPRFISSDRHLAVGMIDVDEVSWNAADQRLSGRSSHLAKDVQFEYVFHAPPPLGMAHAQFGKDEGQVKSLGHGFYTVQFAAPTPQMDWHVVLAPP